MVTVKKTIESRPVTRYEDVGIFEIKLDIKEAKELFSLIGDTARCGEIYEELKRALDGEC